MSWRNKRDYLHNDKNINRVIVLTKGTRNEPIVVWVHDRRVKNTVNLKTIRNVLNHGKALVVKRTVNKSGCKLQRS